MSQPSPAERAAYEVVRRVRSVEVEHHDTDGRQNAVDAMIRYPDGRRAALEVTTLTDPKGRELEQLLADDDHMWTIDGLRWTWSVRVGTGASLKEIRQRTPSILQWCEQYDVTDPYMDARVYENPEGRKIVRWLDRSGVRYLAHPESQHVGRVYLLPNGKGGATGDMYAISRWLTDELRSDRVTPKVSKLLASGIDETNLFLIVDDSGAPFAAFDAMAFGDGLPSGDPEDVPVSAVWLAPRYSRVVLVWETGRGWSRHRPYDN